MINSIKCCVKQCKYNDEKNNSCKAKIVDVAGCSSSTCTSTETMCQTFAPKN